MTRKALGKGLEAIFSHLGNEVVNPRTGSSLHEIDISKISPNPFQPRREFGAEEIQELADSIKEKGLLQPVLLRKHGDGYQLVAGERRYRAYKLLGKTHISAQVRDQVSDRDMKELALIENLQRVQLNPIEEALAFDNLISHDGTTHEELALKVGKSRSTVTNALRLLKLTPEVQTLIREGKLTAGHGRALLQNDPEKQVLLARKILENNLNVRHAEKTGGARAGKGRKPANANIEAFLQKLRFLLGTKVSLKGTENRGVLEIHYLSSRELDALGALMQRGHDAPKP